MLNIVVPMAGRGTRFAEKGYTFPKPLIEVKGKPMIQVVIENLRPKTEHRFTFICQKEHYEKYALHELLNLLTPGCNIVTLEEFTQGAACTVLLAKEYINNDDELMLSNSDQYIETDINHFLEDARKAKVDGSIMTFPAMHPKWSFAKTDDQGHVVEVAEKKPISNHATVGVYYYQKGHDFVQGAEDMIRKDIRVNNEFYVCPVYNEMLLKDRKVKIYEIEANQMHGMGTPEDLVEFEKSETFLRF
ncbi:MAG: glycosyltransferase family 2 protein [Candidatus Gracilibacteria bacterium]